MEALKDYPFRTVFSFRPFIDYLNRAALDSNKKKLLLNDELQEMLVQTPEFNSPIEDFSVLERNHDLVHRLMGLVFAPVFWDIEAVAAVVPFSIEPVFSSPFFKRLFLNQDRSFQGTLNMSEEMFDKMRVIRAYLFILDKFYGIHQGLDHPIILSVQDPETELLRHFRMKLDSRFVEAHAVKDPKELTDKERDLIVENLTEPNILREILPPDDFELHGFCMLQAVDVTESETISALERDLVDQESVVSQEGFDRIQQRLRTLFQRPGLQAGLDAIKGDQVLQLNSGNQLKHCCILADTLHIPLSAFEGSFYREVIKNGEILRIPDITEGHSHEHGQDEAIRLGARSLLIAPLHYMNECIGVLRLGSPEPGDLGPMEALLVSRIQAIFSMAIKKSLDDLDNRIQGIIKEKCTAIHPTVEWRFKQAAFRHLENLRSGDVTEIEPIIFKDVYPLYGVSDIRGSANERNIAIQQDLAEHLDLALNVVLSANEVRPMPVLQELTGRIKEYLEQIRDSLRTGDESSVVKFLQEEVEIIFPQLKGFGVKVIRAIETYLSTIEPNMGTVYRRRREFEESVSTLNERLTTFLDQEETEAQNIFPHYFERHRTDGVDYLVYMGASLMEQDDFNELYLKNMRLWQLKVACGMAWHTERLKSSLKVHLDTAHLIFIQDNPHSIRFRFDEKRFDVDGAYDIRHEIIKSRLDKAMVKGGNERLTQPGKIAIVYSNPEEAEEMQRHIEFLTSSGYLTGETEILELEELPGVQGLRSLRVGINLESQALSEEVTRMTA